MRRSSGTIGGMTKKRTQDRHAPNRTIRIPADLYAELEAVANDTERPVQWEARKAIREHIARHRKSKAQPPTSSTE